MRVALVQISATTDSQANREAIAAALEPVRDVDLVVLPEAVMHEFGTPEHDLGDVAEHLDGPFVSLLADQARRLGAYVVAGMFEGSGGLPWNTLVALGPDGSLAGTYRKVHMYDSFGYLESERLQRGDLSTVVIEVADRRVGLMTCYDLRFPEFARLLVDAGADTLCVPAAWVRGPLKEDHWLTLLRARAIENTVYVLGAGQNGTRYVGGTAVVDPMGVVVATAGEADGVVRAELDGQRLAAVRRLNPSLANRVIDRPPG